MTLRGALKPGDGIRLRGAAGAGSRGREISGARSISGEERGRPVSVPFVEGDSGCSAAGASGNSGTRIGVVGMGPVPVVLGPTPVPIGPVLIGPGPIGDGLIGTGEMEGGLSGMTGVVTSGAASSGKGAAGSGVLGDVSTGGGPAGTEVIGLGVGMIDGGMECGSGEGAASGPGGAGLASVSGTGCGIGGRSTSSGCNGARVGTGGDTGADTSAGFRPGEQFWQVLGWDDEQQGAASRSIQSQKLLRMLQLPPQGADFWMWTWALGAYM